VDQLEVVVTWQLVEQEVMTVMLLMEVEWLMLVELVDLVVNVLMVVKWLCGAVDAWLTVVCTLLADIVDCGPRYRHQIPVAAVVVALRVQVPLMTRDG
jgi:hypothetical protein